MENKSCHCKFLCLCLLFSCSCKPLSSTAHLGSSCKLHYIDEKLRDFIKYIYKLKEPSAQVTNTTYQLLPDSSLQNSLVILETTQPARAWNAFAVGGVSCTFMALPPHSNNYQKSAIELFTFYHELGHVYHNHSTKRRLAGLALVATTVLTYIATSKLIGTSTAQQVISLLSASFLANGFLNYTVEQEVEADLYACTQLKKEDKAFAIREQIALANNYLAHKRNNTRYTVPATPMEKAIQLTHPSWENRARYLQACLDN